MVKLRSSKPSLWVRIPLPLYALLMSWFRLFFQKIVQQNKQINHLFFLIFDWFLVVFKIPNQNHSKSDLSVLNTTKEKYLLNGGYFFLLFDFMYLYLFSIFNSLSNYKNIAITSDKIQQLNNNKFYSFNNSKTLLSTQQLFLYGCKSV